MKRIPLIALAIVLTALLGVAEPLAAAAPHAAGKKTKTVHDTFFAPNVVAIPDNAIANPYPSTINVSGFKKGKITDVNVRLRGLNHGNPDDVDVMLVSPSGERAILMSDAGGSPDALSLTLTIDDDAAAAMPDNAALATGSFQPTNHGPGVDAFPSQVSHSGAVPLSIFNGNNPNGTWKLYVVDDDAGLVGAFSGGWDLKITAKVKKSKKH